MMSLGLLVSGNLGASALKHLEVNHIVTFVMTDNNSDNIIEFCKNKNIKYFVGNPRSGRCNTFIKKIDIDVLISINYLYIIEKELISLPRIMAFNIHGSLLPKYRGRTPHVWAIINDEVETGITAHLIDEGCDTGDIIEQIAIPIDEEDTGADILIRFNEKYLHLVNLVLQKIKDDNILLYKQDHNIASFFGKRTSLNGHINWDWQKKRIYNWIRAQAHPYPGAYTFLNTKKIIIDKISYSDAAFSDNMPNGLILSINPILVKTPNGVVKLEIVRKNSIQFEPNQILH